MIIHGVAMDYDESESMEEDINAQFAVSSYVIFIECLKIMAHEGRFEQVEKIMLTVFSSIFGSLSPEKRAAFFERIKYIADGFGKEIFEDEKDFASFATELLDKELERWDK